MGLQRRAHGRDLVLVVVEFRIKATAEQPAQDGYHVYRRLAPSSRELVEHLAGFLDGGARDPFESGTKSRGRQHLWLHQPRRLVLRSEDSVFGAGQCQDRSAGDELREIARVLADRGVAPLLSQFRDLGRLSGHHQRAPRVGAQDAPLLTLVGVVGIPAGKQPGDLVYLAAIHRRKPEHLHRHDRAVTRPDSSCSTSAVSAAGAALRGGSFNTSNVASGLRARCRPSQSMTSCISTGVCMDASTSVSSAVRTAPVSAAGLVTAVLGAGVAAIRRWRLGPYRAVPRWAASSRWSSSAASSSRRR